MRTMTLSFTLALATVACSAHASELEGTSWRLVSIASMDDSVDLPEDSNGYTLEFGADGRAAIRADCNRGTGSWSSQAPPQLTFGAVATTGALCPSPTIGEKYLAQFEWVRSYTMKDGHLFLATMANGSIMEFEPLPPVAATVLGEDLHANDAAELQAAIVTRLLDDYAADKGIEVEDSELDAYVDYMRQGMAAEGLTAEEDLAPEERSQADAMRREMGLALIRQWKINKALYETYGGRIIYQQFGPEPLDAYRAFLRERQKAGDFTIDDPSMAEAFWQYFTSEAKHDFMEPGSEDAARAFTAPPWSR